MKDDTTKAKTEASLGKAQRPQLTSTQTLTPTSVFAVELPPMPTLVPAAVTVDKKTVEKIVERMKEL